MAVRLLYRIGAMFRDLFHKSPGGFLGLVSREKSLIVTKRSSLLPRNDYSLSNGSRFMFA